ncbi:RHO1 GDP-GTP exchange protein 2, partial [Coemansia sp. RSA 1836]
MESDDSDSGAAVRRRQRRRAGRAAARVSRDLESAELARQRRWAVCPEAGEGGGGGALRRCPSAPSLSEQASDSDASFRTASVRDSAAQQQQRASRDSWFGGSQLSDVTAASSYGGGGAPCPLAPASRLSLGRLSVASGSPQPWHTPPPIAAPPAQAAAAVLPANAAADSYDSGGRPSASADASPAGAMPLLQLQLWRDTVPAQLLQALGPEAVAQQEAIHELVGTERAYLRDLELIDAVFAARLLAQPDVMERTRALGFLHAVFFNYRALIDNSRRLCAQLAARQQASGAVVAGVGDILDAWADDLAAFVEYSVHVPAAQSELEAELLASPQLAQFLADAEAAPEARRLPVQSFIGRPATRFARYPLLLDAIVKRAPPDAERLRSAAAKVRAALAEIDGRTGDGAAAHRIRQINQRLSLPAGARDSLALDSPARRLVKEGVLYVPETGARALVFLFDNSLIVAAEERVAHAKGVSRYVADDRIIPISMLDAGVPPPESSGALVGIREALRLQPAGGQRPALLRHSSSSSTVKALPRTSSSLAGTTTTTTAASAAQAAAQAAAAPAAGLPLAFLHIGCRSLCRTLLVASEAERDQWLAAIARRICVPQTLVEAYTELRLLSDRDFAQHRAPLCSALFAAKSSACQMVLFGSKDGLHLGIYGVPTSVIRVSQPGCVTKIHILHDFNLVIVLSDSNLLVYSLSAIEKSTIAVAAPPLSASQVGVGGGGAAGLVAGTKIASSVTFFDVGVFMSAPLIVLMKLRGSKSHFKCIQPRFNPIESAHGSSDSSTSEDRRDYGSSSAGVGDTSSGHRGSEPPPLRSLSAGVDNEGDMPTLRIVYQGTRTSLHLISEFGVPVSTKSFEIVDVQTSRLLRSLPDPMDDDFSFVIHSNNSGLALASHKVGRDFLLCYESFAFYIDNFGRRSRPHVFIRWEMRPSHISFRHPYVVAINPKFIEVRHIETGVLLSIIRIKNAVCLNPDSTDTILHIAIAPTTTIGTALLLPS